MKKRVLVLILPIVTLVLEILPYSAVLNFMLPSADGSTVGRFKEYYSYFSLTPFGYANYAPLITAVLTCVILFLLGLYCLTGKQRLAVAAKNVLWACTVISLGPLLFGISFFSMVGVLITVSLIAELLLLHFIIKASGK